MQAGEEEKFSYFFEKAVDKTGDVGYNNKALLSATNKYGGIAQLARAYGSYPKCHRFKSSYRYHVTEFR